MAVFRVEKNRDYTVMCNHHLRNKELSLKAKGLLSQMLSLPDNWDYTLTGLAMINRETGMTIIMASHDISAVDYATHVLHLRKSPLFFGGSQEYKRSETGRNFFSNLEINNG